MHRPARTLVEARREAHARMREAELPVPPERQGDLAVVHVPAEHEIECPGRQEAEDVREVAEQDPQISGLIHELPRTRASLSIRTRVDTHHLHAAAA